MLITPMRQSALAVILGLSVLAGCSAEADTAGARRKPSAPSASVTSGTGGVGTSPVPNLGMPVQPTRNSSSSSRVDAGPCVNLQCQQVTCPADSATSISGTVYDPAGNNPLYNVAVYVPNEPLDPLPSGASCNDCNELYSGKPIASALTDSAGKFTLLKAPVGTDIPLVVQVGKWRRTFTISTVAKCQDNPQPDGFFRMPKNHSEGDIPNIAISTGGADTLECLLRRIGIDATEYVPGAGGEGRIHIFQGSAMAAGLFGGGGGGMVVPNTAPPAPFSSGALWNASDSLMAYDIVLLSCEGSETQAMNQQALHDYASAGGRVFASHFHYSWFNSGPYANENLATWTPMSNDIGDINGSIVTTLANGDPFPKGVALSEWLGNVGALQGGLLPIAQARHNADVTAANTPSQAWILAGPDSRAPGATEYLSFNTPTDALTVADGPGYCGRVVYSDLHVGAASGDQPELPVPTGCTDAKLSPQEAALEFMLFDLSSCLTPDDRPPQPPTVE